MVQSSLRLVSSGVNEVAIPAYLTCDGVSVGQQKIQLLILDRKGRHESGYPEQRLTRR